MKSAQPPVHGVKRLIHEGQVMILFAVASLVLLGILALAIDVGFMLAERRQVQAAADAAAMAAAQSGLDNQTSQIVSAGKLYGALNADVPESAVDVDPDATVPTGAEGERYVEVSIVKDVEKYFLGAIYTGSWTVSASAMAAVEPVEADYALITLDEVSTPGILLKGSGDDGGIYITGDNGSAASNSTIEGTNSSVFEVDGAIHAFGDIQGGSDWNPPLGIRANRNRLVPDPLVEAGIIAPEPPPESQSRDQDYIDECMATSPCQLDPGLYSGVNIEAGNNHTIDLKPGLFYFDDSHLSLKNESHLNGNGVLLYFTGNSTFDPKNGNVDLRATAYVEPDEDEDEDEVGVNHNDMVFWMENCEDVNLQGNGDIYFEGIFYAPCSDAWMHGNSTKKLKGQVILGTLDVRGGAIVDIAYESRVETFQPSVFLVN